jgi:hypothetical protein
MDLAQQLFEWHQFADVLCRAADKFAYVTVSKMLASKQAALTYGAWAGKAPADIESRAPHVAYGKLGEMILLDGGRETSDNLILTPIVGSQMSYGWMGGAAINGVSVAVSKWAQEPIDCSPC